MLKAKANPNARCEQGTTALTIASDNTLCSHDDIMRALIEARADVNKGDVLRKACAGRSSSRVRLLLQAKATPTVGDLCAAASSYFVAPDIVVALLDAKASAAEGGRDALEAAAAKLKGSAAYCRLLLNAKCKVTTKALRCAVRHSNAEVCTMLLESKAQLYDTVLLDACGSRLPALPIVHLLMSAKANIHALCPHTRDSALIRAASSVNVDSARVCRTLLEHKALLARVNRAGENALVRSLRYATRHPRAVVSTLLDAGADPKSVSFPLLHRCGAPVARWANRSGRAFSRVMRAAAAAAVAPSPLANEANDSKTMTKKTLVGAAAAPAAAWQWTDSMLFDVNLVDEISSFVTYQRGDDVCNLYGVVEPPPEPPVVDEEEEEEESDDDDIWSLFD
jgi:hypothetical protein